MKYVIRSLACAFVLSTAFVSGCGENIANPVQDDRKSDQGRSQAGRENETFESEILDFAFQAVSRMPSNPHEKNRCRAQSRIVEACLNVRAPQQAARFSRRITNWRRGLSLAKHARYCLNNDMPLEARRSLDEAAEILAQLNEKDMEQEWRVERINLLVQEVEAGLGAEGRSDKGKAGKKITKLSPDEVEEFLIKFAQTMRTENLAEIERSFEHCVELLGDFYADEKLRLRLYQTIKDSYPRLPVPIRIRLLSAVALKAAKNKDLGFGRKVADHIGTLISKGRWRPRDEVAQRADLAALRFDLGQSEEAESQLADALKLYRLKRLAIVSIFRGDATRPIAEAFMRMGKHSQAMDLYGESIDDALENPNSRPRVMELVEVCVSMAEHECQWTPEIKLKMAKLSQQLGDPW